MAARADDWLDKKERGKMEYREMSNAEVDLHLMRNQVARVVYSRSDKLDVELLTYAYEDGWLYGQTAGPRELEMGDGGWWPVALGVEEAVNCGSWRSVVVHGGFHTLDPEGSAWEREEVVKALALIGRRANRMYPQEATAAGVAGHIFRVRVQNVSALTPVYTESAA